MSFPWFSYFSILGVPIKPCREIQPNSALAQKSKEGLEEETQKKTRRGIWRGNNPLRVGAVIRTD